METRTDLHADRDATRAADAELHFAGSYRAPRVEEVGDIDAIQGLYHGYYYDGPNSWNYYDG